MKHARILWVAAAISPLFPVLAGITEREAHAAGAGPTREECVAAADDGQKLRDDGKLSAARDKFVVCAAKACPAVVAKACAGWREDADRDMPSVTFRVTDESGKELLDVKLALDASTDAQPISARAVPLDPGEHVVHVRRDDGKSTDEKFLLRPGEKNRMVDVRLPTGAASATPPQGAAAKPQGAGASPQSDGFRVPLLGWVGLGVGVAGGVTTAIFAVMAKSDESSERSKGCAPGCPSSDKDGINTKLVVANVGMGVGIVGLGVGVVTTVLANTNKQATSTGSSSGKAPSTAANDANDSVHESAASALVRSVRVDASPRGMWLSGSF